MRQVGEQVCYEWFGAAHEHPSLNSFERYSTTEIPHYLRTGSYNKLLSGALLPGETVADPEKNQAEYEAYWDHIKNFRERIEAGEIQARALIGEAALLQVIGGDSSFEERLEIQADAVRSIRRDVLEKGYQVAIAGFDVDTRIVSTGHFSIVGYADRPAGLVTYTRSAAFTEAHAGDPRGIVERSQAAFETVWQRSVHGRENVAEYLAGISYRLANW